MRFLRSMYKKMYTRLGLIENDDIRKQLNKYKLKVYKLKDKIDEYRRN